jgi:simple sugar transport system substrate-binding protein
MRQTFTETAGYDLQLVDCEEKHEKQLEAVSEFITQEVDYIIIAAVSEDGWDQVLGDAKGAGIPVILMDRTINTDDDNWVAWTGGNFLKEGQDAMTWLGTFLEEQGRADTQMNILHMQGQLRSSAQLGRTQGIEESIVANPMWTLLAQEPADFKKDKGKEVMEAWLEQYAGTENLILIAENDNMAYGAIEAMREVGIEPGKDIYILSFDASREALQRVIDGEINCTVECNPLLAEAVERIIRKLENGEIPEKKEYVHEELFDIKNAEDRLDTRGF